MKNNQEFSNIWLDSKYCRISDRKVDCFSRQNSNVMVACNQGPFESVNIMLISWLKFLIMIQWCVWPTFMDNVK